MPRILEIIGALAVVGVIVAGAVVALPGIGISDMGGDPTNSEPSGSANIEMKNPRWGEVSEDSIGVKSKVAITNPRTSFQSQIDYIISLNGYQMVSGGTGETTIESGNSTVAVSSQISRENIPKWWESHIKNGEESSLKIQASGGFSKGPFSTDISTSKTRTIQTNMIESFRSSLSNIEGSSPLNNIEIEDTGAEWGEVNRTQTELIITITVQNNWEYPVPITDFSGESVMGGIQLLDWESNQDEYIISPGEKRQITVHADIRNQQIDRWFASHVSSDETTDYVNKVYFSVADVGGNSPLGKCTGTLKTGIFVNNTHGISNRECQTTPPNNGDLRAAFNDIAQQATEDRVDSSKVGGSEDQSTTTSTPESTTTATPEKNAMPHAKVTASPTTGDAPLTVTFDASGSTDPDGQIVRYYWRFDDKTSPAKGKQVTHKFRTAGTYHVKLMVVDKNRKRDSTTVTVTVESRL